MIGNRKLFYYVIARFFLLVVACWAPFRSPHMIRQIDTMGVSLRYWLRWWIEPKSTAPLLPAVLNSGDNYGITTMELPFLNFILAPIFSTPMEWAAPLAKLVLISISLGLTYWHYSLWKNHAKKDFTLDSFTTASLLLPIFSISGLYFGKFMPDYLAFILISIAIALSWETRSHLKCFFLASLGLLIKPPVVVALGIIFYKKNLKSILSDGWWTVPAVGFTLLYYTLGLDYIRQNSDMMAYFETDLPPPLTALKNFFSHPKSIISLLNEYVFTKFLAVILAPFSLWIIYRKNNYLLLASWLLLIFQVIAVAALDGTHSFIHNYYFIGCSFVAALILVQCYSHFGKILQGLVLLLILVPFLEKSIYEIRPLFRSATTLEEQCRSLVKRNPTFPWRSGYGFRSNIEPYPQIGLCFGERQNSLVSEFGFFNKESATPIPEDCWVIDQTDQFVVVQCKI